MRRQRFEAGKDRIRVTDGSTEGCVVTVGGHWRWRVLRLRSRAAQTESGASDSGQDRLTAGLSRRLRPRGTHNRGWNSGNRGRHGKELRADMAVKKTVKEKNSIGEVGFVATETAEFYCEC
ncbi:hypothetical protein GW17_00023208 [Ensete ventricosum]|nr:hypothetical protein GW17_00023208 [Ensete ventricosum]